MKNINFLLIKKKTRGPKAGGSPRQGTFPYTMLLFFILLGRYLVIPISILIL